MPDEAVSTIVAGRVLVVDDEENIVASLKGVLEDGGLSVLTASGGEEALQVLDRETTDVVLLDIWMPNLDGMETLRRIKGAYPEVQVIMVTGHGTIETAVAATKMGAFEFIEKPLSVMAVTQAVDRALQHRRDLATKREQSLGSTRREALLGQSRTIEELRQAIPALAASNAGFLIEGEIGVGKELFARLVHGESRRRDRPFARYVVPESDAATIERELFGPDGAWARAGAGTLYVDRVERLPRSLRDALFSRPGPRVAGGALPPGADVPEGVRKVAISPLRDRQDDVPALARAFLEAQGREQGRSSLTFSGEAEAALARYRWPGNVKELRGVVAQIVLASLARPALQAVGLSDLPSSILTAADAGTRVEARDGDDQDVSFEEAERRWEAAFLARVLARHDGSVDDTARRLHLSPIALQKKLVAYGLLTPQEAGPGQDRIRPQRTLARSVVLCGQGLHSGLKTGLILNPLPPGSGILFGSISHGDTVPARVEFVDRTGYATGLRRGKAIAKTIEHFMATLHAYGVTNLLIKIADEVPIMDGSARDFCQLLDDGGIIDQDATVEEIVIEERLAVGDPDAPDGEGISIEPAARFGVSYDLVYPKPVGHQHYAFTMADAEPFFEAFRERVAPARTFGFLKDIEKLEEMGLASGGRLSNFILIDDEKVVNTELRFEDELVRHKILDIVGDSYLLGRPIRGHIRARKTGHEDNVALVKLIQSRYLA
ncbi:MAG: UDP-3-O-acyl-N-acetylglucosamine deacetylase [Acidobacteriota bacterium]